MFVGCCKGIADSPLVRSKIFKAAVFVPKRTRLELPFLCYGFHFWESKCMYFQNYDYARSLKGTEKMYQALPSSPNSKILKSNRFNGNTPPGLSLIVQMKRGKQDLKRVYFYLRLYVVFLSLFKINRIAVSFFVKKYGLHDCQPFLVLCLIFWRVRYTLEDFKKSLSSICFFNKVFIWTVYKKAFRFGRLLLGYVVCFVSVYTISCCLQCRVLVILCLCTYYIIFFTSVYH